MNKKHFNVSSYRIDSLKAEVDLSVYQNMYVFHRITL